MLFYCCGTTWQYERGYVPVTYTTTIEHCKRINICWETCGIVEVDSQDDLPVQMYDCTVENAIVTLDDEDEICPVMQFVRWVEPENFENS